MMEIWKWDAKEEGDSDKKRKKKKNRAESSSILFSVFVWPVGLMLSVPSLCLFTITVLRMNLPRMTAQLAALTSQEQGSY